MDSLMRELTIYPFCTLLATPKILCSSLGITFLKDIKCPSEKMTMMLPLHLEKKHEQYQTKMQSHRRGD